MENLSTLISQAKSNPALAAESIRTRLEQRFTLRIKEVLIRQSAVSLNSVNGSLMTNDNRKYFFKFHSEENEKGLSEYYRANVLKEVGLPVLEPTFQSTKPGEQVLIYPWIDAPTAYDLWLQDDEGKIENVETLLRAERALCDACAETCRKTLTVADAEAVGRESIWMLFSRRLSSDDPNAIPRFTTFYEGKTVALPDGTTIPFSALAEKKWIINGREYKESLGEIVAQAKAMVTPDALPQWPVVTAHGDEHNGNKFLIDGQFVFFDPAFASTGIPALLAFVKTTFHDTFAHPFWLYEPAKAMPKLSMSCTITDETIAIDHNWELENVAPERRRLLEMKMECLWKPLITLLRERKLLDSNWQQFVKKALACCPLLVDNLIGEKYPPELKLLGLGRCVEMGSSSSGNLIDRYLSAL